MQTFQKPLTPEEETFYLAQSRTGDLTARNILVERNLRLVAHIVKKYNTGERDMEDLISTGVIGLIKAINTYNPGKGNKLGTYASRCIENELLMLLRQERKSSKEISLYEPIGSDKEGNEINLMDIIDSKDEDILEHMITDNHISTGTGSDHPAIWFIWPGSDDTEGCRRSSCHFKILCQPYRKTCS